MTGTNTVGGGGVPQCSKCDNIVCWYKDTRKSVNNTASTRTSKGRKFKLGHSRGRPHILAAPHLAHSPTTGS